MRLEGDMREPALEFISLLNKPIASPALRGHRLKKLLSNANCHPVHDTIVVIYEYQKRQLFYNNLILLQFNPRNILPRVFYAVKIQ